MPVLAGSAAYAVAEAMHWRGSLDERPRASAEFYAVLTAAVIVGLLLDYPGFNAVRMLFWAAVINGVLAPPLIVLVVLLTSGRKVMGRHVSPPLLRWLGWLTASVMTVAGAAMIITSLS